MKPSPEFCRAVLRYEPFTGKLFWKVRGGETFKFPKRAGTWNAQFAGKEAFGITHVGWGHKQGAVGGHSLKAHVVIWAIVHGEWPTHEIDHINGDPSDNRLENLRHVSATENCQNKSRYRSNKSGRTGVFWEPRRHRWVASIVDGAGRQVYLGSFANIDEASARRAAAEERHGYHPNHGRVA